MRFIIGIFLLPFLILTTLFCSGQVCNGYLGGPAARINFGSGVNQGPALPAGVTTYQFTPENCPEDGAYTLTRNCNGCKKDWHVLSSDHTGGTNGHMMLVNASFTPGTFYTQTVKGQLCGNTTYEFGAWMMNILKPEGCLGNGIKPNITFTISTPSGATMATFNTGDIAATATPKWNQYAFLFKTPPGVTDVVIKMTNNAPGGCGNDLVIDDISFRACAPLIHTRVGNRVTNTVYLCDGEGGAFTLYAPIGADYTNPVYQWQYKTSHNELGWTDVPGQTDTLINIDASPTIGIYQYRLAIAESPPGGTQSCWIYSNPVTIDVSAYPDAIASSNSPACARNTLQLNASGGATYRWTGPNGFSSNQQNPVIRNVSFAAAGEYKVIVTSAKGCSSETSTTVTVNPSPTVQVGSSVTICEGSSTVLQASGSSTYQWSPVAGLSDATIANPVASPTDTTTYTVTITNEYGCTDSKSVTVNVLKKPVADAGADQRMMVGESAGLKGIISGTNVRYSWSPSTYLDDPTLLNPIATPPEDITYTLTVISNDGCGIATDAVFIRVFTPVSVPNTFSPNGDAINDSWNIQSLDKYPQARTMVYNRNGQLIYQQIQSGIPWDGRFNGEQVAAGSYYYIIELEKDLPKLTGWVLLIR